MPSTLPSGREPDDDYGIENDWTPDDEDDGDEIDDPAFAGDDDDEVDSQTVPCPECGQDVYENADYCPACGAAIVPGDAVPGRKAWIVAAVLLVALLAGVFLCL